MKLPNAHLATVPEQKVTRYLLNPAHPSKAPFFLRFGFTADDWRGWPRRCSGMRERMKWSRLRACMDNRSRRREEADSLDGWRKNPPRYLGGYPSRHFHTPSEETRHGTRYVVDGPLNAPDGTVLRVRSAWYIDPNGDAPRFVTAHPLPKL